jgi:hypothetical protein
MLPFSFHSWLKYVLEDIQKSGHSWQSVYNIVKQEMLTMTIAHPPHKMEAVLGEDLFIYQFVYFPVK